MKNFINKLFTLTILFTMLLSVSIASANEVDVLKDKSILTSTEIDETLLENGFTEEDISRMSERVKLDIVQSDGKKAVYDVVHKRYYTSLDGTRYEITDENQDEIAEIQKRDIEEYSAETGMDKKILTERSMLLNSSAGKTAGALDLYSTIYKVTSGSSTEHEYKVELNWYWDKAFYSVVVDNAGIAWDNRFTGIANTVGKYFESQFGENNNNLSTTPQVYGIKASYPLATYASYQIAGFWQNVRVSKNYTNQTGRIVAGYGHSLSNANFGINIGPASISIPGGRLVEEHYLEMNLTIGQ